MGKLTAKGVAALREPGRYGDGDGLHLRIDSAGRRYWVVRVQLDGRRRDYSLGREGPLLRLGDAREAALRLRMRLVGGAPEVRAALAAVRAPTFKEAALEVHAAGRMGESATPHGFRSSFKEWSLTAGWPDYLSERQLAHVDKDKVRAAYARSDLLEERRPMLEAWGQFISGSAST